MNREIIQTGKVYASPNPLSQAVKYGNLVFVSGFLAKEPVTGKVVLGGMCEQTKQVIENIKHTLEAAGSSLDDVLKVTVYITDKRKFEEMNKVYRSYFSKEPPARICVEVSGIMRDDCLVEIDCIAAIQKIKHV